MNFFFGFFIFVLMWLISIYKNIKNKDGKGDGKGIELRKGNNIY